MQWRRLFRLHHDEFSGYGENCDQDHGLELDDLAPVHDRMKKAVVEFHGDQQCHDGPEHHLKRRIAQVQESSFSNKNIRLDGGPQNAVRMIPLIRTGRETESTCSNFSSILKGSAIVPEKSQKTATFWVFRSYSQSPYAQFSPLSGFIRQQIERRVSFLQKPTLGRLFRSAGPKLPACALSEEKPFRNLPSLSGRRFGERHFPPLTCNQIVA